VSDEGGGEEREETKSTHHHLYHSKARGPTREGGRRPYPGEKGGEKEWPCSRISTILPSTRKGRGCQRRRRSNLFIEFTAEFLGIELVLLGRKKKERDVEKEGEGGEKGNLNSPLEIMSPNHSAKRKKKRKAQKRMWI